VTEPDLVPRPSRQPHDATVVYPGGLRARWRWGGSGEGPAVFALSEAGGSLTDHGPLAGSGYEELCRAELRIDGPAGPWTVRLASLIFDEPTAVAWDDHGLLVVRYGFLTYGFDARSGALRWSHRSASPLLAVFASPRLPHVLAQAEVETFALEADGTVAWRVAHSDVVTAAELVGGRLVLTSFGGAMSAIDPLTGRATS
jgi:outer membrane protein assembly factor BamB